jgi:hypothetical protein
MTTLGTQTISHDGTTVLGADNLLVAPGYFYGVPKPRKPDFTRKLARRIEPAGGPGVELETLGDAAGLETQMEIKTIGDYRRAVRNGPYAWPGGYPVFFATSDGASLCWECGAKKARHQVIAAIAGKDFASGWRVNAVDVNWESADLHCDHCTERVPSAYAEPGETEERKRRIRC